MFSKNTCNCPRIFQTLPARAGAHVHGQCSIPTPTTHGSTLRLDGRSTFDIAAQWTEHCLARHSSCPSTGETQLLNRVLFIGTIVREIRLFQANNISGRYACLSHCWGGNQVLKTTKNNLEAHEQSIAWDVIPKSFQDAIRVATTSSPDASTGLFLKDNNNRLEISGTTSAGKNLDVHVNWFRVYELVYQHYLVRRWPLLERAWAFQELLLSPRVIYFTIGELMWECQGCTRRECGCAKKGGKEKFHPTMGAPTTTSLVEQWEEIVERYCSLELSRPSDKLPALSGLVKSMQNMRTSEEYFAKLWSGSLMSDLLWFNTGKNETSIPKIRTWRAPSWSWASTDAYIEYPHRNWVLDSNFEYPTTQTIQPFSTVENVETVLTTKDIHGQVKSGSIKIRGPVFDAKFVDAGNASLRLELLIEGSRGETWQWAPSLDMVYFDFLSNPLQMAENLLPLMKTSNAFESHVLDSLNPLKEILLN